MKVIILAGGLPSTLIEEDEKMPKPMAEIGGRPMLWIQRRSDQGLLHELLYLSVRYYSGFADQ